MLRILTVISLLALSHSVPVQQDAEQHDLDFVLRNMTALWEEVSNLRQEISQHLHDGHHEADHDKVVREVETLHHEHHVHHLHHPHVGHNDHHKQELLRHLEDFHGHMDNHSAGQLVHGHAHGHGHAHDHHHGQPQGDAKGDSSDESGEDDSHEAHGDHHDDEHDHEHGDEEDHTSHHADEDEHDTHGLHEHEDEHEYGHEHGHKHGEHAEHDDAHGHGHGHKHVGKADDPWHHALCVLKPNVDMPESQVSGSIVLSQRKDGKGPVFYDINLTGIDVSTTGRIHGFHVHEREVTDGSCGSTGGHFNPTKVTHGAPGDDVRHSGDLGNIEVDENGELHNYIIADSETEFDGDKSILGKAIVVHAGVDDLGKGGDAGSLATGNAGGRLACCNIILQRSSDMPEVSFRFKG